MRETKPESVTLSIGGVSWSGWESCQVVKSVDSMAGAFALGLTDRTCHGGVRLPIAPGMDCLLETNGDHLVKGYIDKVEHSLTSSSHGIRVDGRDSSADLVDCSAVHRPGQWRDMNVLSLAMEIASPFGVQVAADADASAIVPSFQISPGETAAKALQRLLKLRGLLAMPDSSGGLRLATLGTSRMAGAVIEGVNVLSCTTKYDASKRYSEYICTGQKQGADTAFGEACSVRGQASDGQIGRYRPLIVRPGQQGSADFMRRRAQWELSTRRAQGTTVDVSVRGWRDEGGRLWTPGAMVKVSLPTMGLDQDLLIAEVTLTKSMQGTVASLSLKDPAAYSPEPAESGKVSSAESGSLDIYVRQSRDAKAAGESVKEAL